MKNVNMLLKDQEFVSYLQKNTECETDRIYCCHDLTHALDVARIAYILNLEENLGLSKQVVYAAGLTHDIGRWMEYESGISHETASAILAEELLLRNEFDYDDIADIVEAIGNHRTESSGSVLSSVLYRADKLSRNCPSCDAIKTCKNFKNNVAPLLQY